MNYKKELISVEISVDNYGDDDGGDVYDSFDVNVIMQQSTTVVLNVLGLKLLHLYILDEYVSYMLALTESVTI